ncbi:TonB-dependent receptor plug domain-containing protein [Draconibacterium halophilum]|uniref:TonB-dependent receptor plug domain-containing protein n=1 Tax=Draconibacterium halophilum TaxID=2706887 RepID=A0A6C0RCX8_9BACT|nr:TonB-dependent receptor plug domain-containing protein [Draconibacterium halophilum]QIA07907.1 TonB-dependent receptor plug domain-containing protein [Draconibacterium halophilum]
MDNRFFTQIIFLVFLLFATNTQAQDRTIQGKVTTFENIPLSGVEVQVKSTKQLVKTDTLGRFKVACNVKDKLIFFAHGFNKQKVKLKENTKFVAVNLHLKPGEKGKALAIGYGHVQEEDKLSAISSLRDDNDDFSKYTDMYELIRGRFSGVQIIGDEVIIRGNKTLGSSNAALIVVDGIERDGNVLSILPPNTVKSIDILKDGGSAIYGSRGANGVVLIETKRGDENE